jgi:phosphohistidine phosphatase
MRTLHLLRHAKSSWDDPGLDDHDRPLAPRGTKAARHMASHLEDQRISVRLVLCSSAVRARQTLDLVMPALGGSPDIRIEDELYGADATDLLARLRRIDEAVPSVLLVGHNPALQQLAEVLAGDGDAGALQALQRKFPTGALATVTARSTWRGLQLGSGYLESFVVPRRLSQNES